MNPWSIVITAVLFIAAVVCAIADARAGYEPAPITATERFLTRFFAFFAIGGVPPFLALAVLLSTGAVSCAALDIVASLYFAGACPAWFPADAAATGLGVGLLCSRVIAASPAPPVPPGPPSGPAEPPVYPREAGYSF